MFMIVISTKCVCRKCVRIVVLEGLNINWVIGCCCINCVIQHKWSYIFFLGPRPLADPPPTLFLGKKHNVSYIEGVGVQAREWCFRVVQERSSAYVHWQVWV